MDSAKSNSNTDSKRIQAKQVLKSLVILAAAYCLLMACWFLVGKAYSKFYCAGANSLFGSFGSRGVVRVRTSNDASYDVELFLSNVDRVDASGSTRWVHFGCSSRRGGYMYVSFLIALIVATPIPIRRKLWALLWGLILVHCLISGKLAVQIIDAFSREPLGLFVINPFWEGILYILYRLMVNVTFGFIVVVFIWILVTFRRGDWTRIICAGVREPGSAHKDLKRRKRAIGVGA